MAFSPLTKQLVDALKGLPGVGPKSAQRMAFTLLAKSGREKGQRLAHALAQAMELVRECVQCRLFAETNLCDICSSPKRDKSLLCVVENAADVAAIEQVNSYRGLYFVLQGHLSPLDGVGPNEIGIPQLIAHVQKNAVTEIILATNPTIEGKTTAHYIATHMPTHIKCTRIAHGVPMGGELEYLDGGTLSHALLARVPIEN